MKKIGSIFCISALIIAFLGIGIVSKAADTRLGSTDLGKSDCGYSSSVTSGGGSCYIREAINVAPPTGWYAVLNSSTAYTNAELKAAPSNASDKLYLCNVAIFNNSTAGTVKLLYDTASSSGSGTVFGATLGYDIPASQVVNIPFNPCYALPAGKNLGFTSATVMTHAVHATGYVGK